MFTEPVRVVAVSNGPPGTFMLGVVEVRSERFRQVTLRAEELASITVHSAGASFDGDGALLRLGLQAYCLGIAHEFDPYFGLSISRVDPLPHQLEAVYDYLLKLARVRFLLADDAGAGKTIMSGLLIRELKLRGLAERILIVAPANLAFQWQRELKEKFDETFVVMKGADIREQFGVNQWLDRKQIVTSLDLAKRDEILPGLKQVHWDLIIVDEAHRMSWTPPSAKTARYALGELLRDTSDHLLMLTATPHKGDPGNFSLFLQLLDKDAFADVISINEAMDRRRAPFYLRRTKEAMVNFPQRQPDGSWAAPKLFKKRFTHTADFLMDGEEFELYREVTRFVKRNSTRAAQNEDDPRARAVGFLMALYQRRFASSARALQKSLENRAKRLEEALKDARLLARQAPASIPDQDDLEEMDEQDRNRIESIMAAVTLADSAEQVKVEVGELRQLAAEARRIEDAGCEAKLSKLKETLKQHGFFEDPNQRLLLFTEFKDTLDYLVEKLTEWGFRVGTIHGGMQIGSRDQPGTRLFVEQQFRQGDIQILVATEAAGEGINLQCCHILFNYDIPWNPNRLEQRMGRIHRYGQQKDCLIFNFVATNTVEGRVLDKLWRKLDEIRRALDDDAVFNVVGEVLPAAQIERLLRDYYAGRMGEEDLEDRLMRNVQKDRFEDICRNALEGLASKSLNLEMLVERRARAKERRVVPETIARFLAEAAPRANLNLKPVASLPHAFEPGATPIALRHYEREPSWRLPAVANRYPKLSTDRKTAEDHNLEWVTPGHPLFEALRRHVHRLAEPEFAKGACFYSLAHEAPARLDVYRARVVDGLGDVIHERVFVIESGGSGEGEPRLRDPGALGDLTPAPASDSLPPIAAADAEPTDWLHEHALAPFLDEVKAERVAEIDRVADHVDLSLTELLAKVDQEIGAASEEVNKGVGGAEGRLTQAEQRHADLFARRDRRRQELGRQRALTLQNVERLTTILILPHPEQQSSEVRNLRPNPETELIAMEAVMQHERDAGRHPHDVSEKNLGYDITSLDLNSGEIRLIEVKGIGAASGTVLLTPNEHRVAQDRRDCYWLYVVTDCGSGKPVITAVADPAQFDWSEVIQVQHYALRYQDLKGRSE